MPRTKKDQDTNKGVRPFLNARLQNFRIFQDSGWFKLAPLTCLVGRNSSGKSSLLNAILLLKQSIEQEGMNWTGTPLTLSGPYCDLGNYSDVVYNHEESSEITIALSMPLKRLASADQRPMSFVELGFPRSMALRRYPFYFSDDPGKLPARGNIDVRLTFSADEPFGPSLSKAEISVGNVGFANFASGKSGERKQNWRIQKTNLPPRSLELRSGAGDFFPIIGPRQASLGQCSASTKRRIRIFLYATRIFFRFLEQSLLRSDFVGPFRTPPERRYPFGGFSSSRRSASGEQATNLLITEALLRRTGPRPLHKALSFWIRHLKLAESLDVKDIARRLNLFEVEVAGAGTQTQANFADVGFGVSQVLPVLVKGLLMRRGGIFLVQQPEIHLHPDAQAGLADFFLYLASYGVITIVETHSEYLLLRVRRRLAEGIEPVRAGLPIESTPFTPLTKDDVSILFTGADEKVAIVKQLQIGPSFQFENLPPGFMSQALEDRVALLEAVGKRNG